MCELLARVPAEYQQHGFMSSNFINSPLHGEPTCHDLSGVADSPVSPVEDESPGEKKQHVSNRNTKGVPMRIRATKITGRDFNLGFDFDS